ncbi:MAG: hypothetical protein M1832_006443 [Thelocarpon impressellum]|nr:MAG: hypothetical protein M1832_006443 [Thelocarpon impressellum]
MEDTSATHGLDNESSDGMLAGIIVFVQFAYPIAILVDFLVTFTVHGIVTASDHSVVTGSETRKGPGGKPLPKRVTRSPKEVQKKQHADFSPWQKTLFGWLLIGVITSFLANAVNIIVHALTKRPWWCGQAPVIYVVGSVFVYGMVLVSVLDTKPSPNPAHLSAWVLGLLLEAVLLGLTLAIYTSPRQDQTVISGRGGAVRKHPNAWEVAEVTIALARIILLLALVGLYAVFAAVRYSQQERAKREAANGPDEASRLLGEGSANENGVQAANGTNYGSNGTIQKQDPPEDAPAGWSRPVKTPSKSWWEYIKGYSLFFPYLWPAKSRRLQVIVVICFVLVLLQRGVNVLVPYQVGVVINILSGSNGEPPRLPWGEITLYILYRFLQGGSGVLGAMRSTLWVPIGQYSYQALSTSAFEHVHSLSLDFHLGKKTGEVLSALSKGNAINNFLEQVTFQVVPMLVDLGVAIGYFLFAFDAYYALVVAIVTLCYLYLTIRLAQWRTEIRREMVNAGREEDAVKNDSMVSYETVKYFNAENYEFDRYRNAVKAYQKAEYQVLLSLSVMNVSQNLVFTLGLLVTCFIAAYQVTMGEKVGRFVALLTYMAQLQGPLNFFGTFYRSIQSAMINSERMLELFKESPTVVDDPTAEALALCEGEIRFEDIQFSYDARKPALQGLSFRCPPGTTTALVGESGGGKSTVFRLLFRFYNASDGSLKVDGHDVRDITIDSLRKHIGVVPQDTVLFNETLMYNLKYANPECTDEAVFEACRAASIHEKILSFPDGYQTKVGERGLRLSGGEKQRVAIARTILKDPKIILLDEATAALDSETEQHIQSALQTLSKGRTMLVIAHRLSTITAADQILCLHAGRVVEAGTHEELLAIKGRYANMWKKQIHAERAAKEAQALKDRADKLREEGANGVGSGEASGEVSDNEPDVHEHDTTKPAR